MRKPLALGLILFLLHALLAVSLYRDWLPFGGAPSTLGDVAAGYTFVFEIPAWLLGLTCCRALLTAHGPMAPTVAGWWVSVVFWLWVWPMLAALVWQTLRRRKA